MPYFSHVSCLFADTNVTPSFSENSPVFLLQLSHAGIIFSPLTFELYTCAPKVAVL